MKKWKSTSDFFIFTFDFINHSSVTNQYTISKFRFKSYNYTIIVLGTTSGSRKPCCTVTKNN